MANDDRIQRKPSENRLIAYLNQKDKSIPGLKPGPHGQNAVASHLMPPSLALKETLVFSWLILLNICLAHSHCSEAKEYETKNTEKIIVM